MATEMKSLIGNVLFIVTLCTGMRSAVADPETATVWSDCGNSGKYEYRNGSAFQLNLNNVLESLVRNVYPSGFNTSSIVAEGVNSNDTVYGLVQCRGDLDSSDCKQCASTAEVELVQGCHNTSGFIQLDGCFLRYDNHNFYNDIKSRKSPQISVLCNTDNSSQPQQFTNAVKALLSNVTAQAAQSPKLFAADLVAAPGNLTQTIYSLAQCWRDLSQTSCGSCLTEALSNIFRCQSGAIGAQFGSQNCYLRYEVYEFFNISVSSPPPEESLPVSSERKKTRVFGITLGVVGGGTLGLIAALLITRWNCFSCRKRPEQNSRTRDPEIVSGLRISVTMISLSLVICSPISLPRYKQAL